MGKSYLLVVCNKIDPPINSKNKQLAELTTGRMAVGSVLESSNIFKRFMSP